MTLPSIAVVMPCWNAAPWLRRAIDSVLAQGSDCAELIVVDDGSTDGSLEIIRSYGDRLLWRSGPNRGSCASRNDGLAMATADYVMFLDSDDYLEGPFLAGIRAAAAAGARPDLVLSRWVIERDGSRIDLGPPRDPVEMRREFLEYNVQTASIAFERGFLGRIGGWSTAVVVRQDAEIALRALLHRPSVAFNREGLAVWAVRPGHGGVSTRDDAKAWRSLLDWYDDHRSRPAFSGDAEFARSYAEHYYNAAMNCYSRGWRDLGDRALAGARALGLSGHPGGFRHRVLSRVFGLRVRVTVFPAAKRRLLAVLRRGR